MRIKYKLVNSNCDIKCTSKGEWIDLKAASDVAMSSPHNSYKTRITDFNFIAIPLGIAMKLPKHFEANIVPRSSLFKNHGVISANSFGVVDASYCGNNDIWGFPAIALKKVNIKEGDRICQFRIRPSQFAPWYVKLKWLFTSKLTFVRVNDLKSVDRGGFGSTGI